MQFRLIDLFKWTTLVAVALPAAIWAINDARQMPYLNPVGVVFLIAYWGAHFAVAYLIFRWVSRSLAKATNDWWATLGMCAGIACGVVVGLTNTRLGEWAVDRFNPDLVRWEWEPTFGVLIASVPCAFLGALLGAIAGAVYRRLGPNPEGKAY